MKIRLLAPDSKMPNIAIMKLWIFVDGLITKQYLKLAVLTIMAKVLRKLIKVKWLCFEANYDSRTDQYI